MGALPKRRTSSYRRGKRRSQIKKDALKKLASMASFYKHALKKAHAVK